MVHFQGSPLYQNHDHYDKEMCFNKEASLQNSLYHNTSLAFENDRYTKNIDEKPNYTKEKVSAQLKKYNPDFINDVFTHWHEELCEIIPLVLV